MLFFLVLKQLQLSYIILKDWIMFLVFPFSMISENFFTGYNPIFDESFEFQINLPELALVRFAVLDDEFIGDEFIGQYTIPFECMETGKYNNKIITSYFWGKTI